jgi:methionyl-tRNA synthetase
MKEGKEEQALALLGLIANILAKVAVMLHPVMPKTTDKIARALGFTVNTAAYEDLIKRKDLLGDFTIEKIPPLFPRIEEVRMPEATPGAEAKKEAPKAEAKKSDKAAPKPVEGLITIDQFFQTQLKVGTVVEAEEVPKSKKLLKLQVDLGEEAPRQIIAGIKEWYAPADLVGTQVCVVANLKPAKLMGMLSEGMLLAAKDESGLSLIRPEAPKAAGTPIG